MNHIKEAREKRGFSQKQIAIQLNVSPPTVSDWESGKKRPSSDNLGKLSDMLNVSTDYLLGFSEVPFTADIFVKPLAERFNLDPIDFSNFYQELSSSDIALLHAPAMLVPARTDLRLKRARFASGLRIDDLVSRLSISRAEYEEYEAGNKKPNYSVLKSISEILKVDLNWLNCSIQYISPETNLPFDPGDYKSFIDSAFDPIERNDEQTSFCLDLPSNIAHIVNLSKNSNIVKKYQALDIYGKRAVDGVLNSEYDRVTQANPEQKPAETKRVWLAARSTDNAPSGWVDMPAEEVERIFNAPDADVDF